MLLIYEYLGGIWPKDDIESILTNSIGECLFCWLILHERTRHSNSMISPSPSTTSGWSRGLFCSHRDSLLHHNGGRLEGTQRYLRPPRYTG